MPVSATQSIVGATVGFSLVLRGSQGIQWWQLATIGMLHLSALTHCNILVLSWVASPLLAGAFSVLFYLIIKVTVFDRRDPLNASIHLLPWAFWFTLSINLFTVFYNGSKCKHCVHVIIARSLFRHWL
jgi:sodium-dependent phosphate transporter